MTVKKTMVAMAALNFLLWVLFTLNSLSPFRGYYNSEGTLILANGQEKNIKITTSVDDDESYEVLNIEGFYMEFYRQIYSRLWKDYRFYNMSEGLDQMKDHLEGDNRLIFNYLYTVRKGTRLTAKNVFDRDVGACFYIVELNKIRCLNR